MDKCLNFSSKKMAVASISYKLQKQHTPDSKNAFASKRLLQKKETFGSQTSTEYNKIMNNRRQIEELSASPKIVKDLRVHSPTLTNGSPNSNYDKDLFLTKTSIKEMGTRKVITPIPTDFMTQQLSTDNMSSSSFSYATHDLDVSFKHFSQPYLEEVRTTTYSLTPQIHKAKHSRKLSSGPGYVKSTQSSGRFSHNQKTAYTTKVSEYGDTNTHWMNNPNNTASNMSYINRHKSTDISVKNFQRMGISELLKHEKGILNLYEQNKGKGINNKAKKTSIFDIKLTRDEYESIFDKPASFYEKKAFVDVFRKKWREDKGYCSLFDKRGAYKNAAQSSQANSRPSTAGIRRMIKKGDIIMNGTSMNISNFNESPTRGRSEDTRRKIYRAGLTFSQIQQENKKAESNGKTRVVNIDHLDSGLLSPRRDDHSPPQHGFEHNQNVYPSYSVHKESSESPQRRVSNISKMEVIHTEVLDTELSERANGYDIPGIHIHEDKENPEKTESQQLKAPNTVNSTSRNDKMLSPNKEKKYPYSETPMSPACKLFEIPLEKYKQSVHIEKFFSPFELGRKNRSSDKKRTQKKENMFNTLRRINNNYSPPSGNISKRFDSPLHIQNTTGDETDQDMLRIDSFTYYLNKRTDDKRSKGEILRNGQKGSVVYSRKVQESRFAVQKEDTIERTKRDGDDQYEDEHEFLKQRKLYNYEQ